MSGNLRRLEKLEAALLPLVGPAALAALTTDELQVRILDVARRVAADPLSGDTERASAAKLAGRIEDGIRHQAALARRPFYAAHLDAVGLGRARYVSALCAMDGGDGAFSDDGGVEYSDLGKPRIMSRRAALRARPDIAVLIEEGSRV